MNDKLKKNIIITGAIIVAVASFTYGALTAPQSDSPRQQTATSTPKVTPNVKPPKQSLEQQLTTNQPVIANVLISAYPKISTDYVINKGQLFDEGEWYGTTLVYRGNDTLNRDTLRVLMQKKKGVWVLRTTPPQPLLSTKEFPDVPRDILQAINEPVSLP